MARRHPKELSAISIAKFKKLVPQAVEVGEASFRLPSRRLLRVKRGEQQANQVHATWLETLVLHVPRQKDRWYVVPPRWQIHYALSGKARPHHALIPIECMLIPIAAIPTAFRVKKPRKGTNLFDACERASADTDGLRDLARDLDAVVEEHKAKIEKVRIDTERSLVRFLDLFDEED